MLVCGEIFVVGYHASVGIQFWLTGIVWISGIIYWAVRGREERCPMCKSRDIDIREYREIDVSKTEDRNRVKDTCLGVVV